MAGSKPQAKRLLAIIDSAFKFLNRSYPHGINAEPFGYAQESLVEAHAPFDKLKANGSLNFMRSNL
jgi:hypothetical protein